MAGRVVACALAGCVLPLSSGTTVLAKGERHGTGLPAVPVSAPASQGKGNGHGGQQGQGGAGGGGPVAPSVESAPAGTQVPGAAQGQAATRRGHGGNGSSSNGRGASHAADGRGAHGNRSGDGNAAAPTPGVSATSLVGGGGAESQPSHGNGSHGHDAGKRTSASASPVGLSAKSGSTGRTSAAPSSPPAAVAAATPSPAAPAVVASSSPAAVAPATVNHRARPTGRRRRRGARRAPHPKGGVKSASARAGARRVGAIGVPSRTIAARTTGRSGARGAKHARGRSEATRLAPLARTVTRIVGVVPLPMRILLGILLVAALALGLRSRTVERRAKRLERQRGELLEDVGLLQAALLPAVPRRLGPVQTSAAYRPADGPGAGGDFYDVFALDDGRIAAIVGDVSGHGRHALPHTALVRFTLRAYLEAGLQPREALQTAAGALDRQLGESYATVVLATYQPRERLLTYASAGHPPPIVLGSQPLEPVTVCAAPPLGAGLRTGTRQTTLSLEGASQVCLYTDGLTEARVAGELFGGERLREALLALGRQATAPALLDELRLQTDARPDDMAACVLSIEGGSAAPRVLLEELEVDAKEGASDRTKRFLLACGVERREVAALLPLARAEAEKAGTVLIGVHRQEGELLLTLRRNNVAPLHVGRVRRKAVAR